MNATDANYQPGDRVNYTDNYGNPATGTVTESRRGWVTVQCDNSPSSGYRNDCVREADCSRCR